MPGLFCRRHVLFCGLVLLSSAAGAQRFLSDYDSTLFLRDTMVNTVRRFENLVISGYMQPQFQRAAENGISTFEGPNFGQNVATRFLLRRARVKLDYILPAKEGAVPKALFTFQFEATERDLNIRDMFLRVYEPRRQNLSVTMGLVSRPFGYEVNLSSAFRETPERGRMSQILMPSERDLGAMASYEPQRPRSRRPRIKFDVGIFNGQGKSGPAEFDNYKDLISRLTVRPARLSKTFSVSGGLSVLRGGWRQDTRYTYKTAGGANGPRFVVDSALTNIGAKAPRRYHGADVQLLWKSRWGKTEGRAEYWRGTQPGTATTTANPGAQPEGPTYIRRFDGAFFYLLQNIGNTHWELMLKYDWYDPNTGVTGRQIGKPGSGFTAADVKYSTLGIGLTHYFSDHLKLLAYQSFVRNEQTTDPDYATDRADNVFTLRLQMRF